MTVQVFHEADRSFGVLTDCADEDEFIRQFSLIVAEAVFKACDIGSDPGGKLSHQEEMRRMYRSGASTAAELISRSVEIILKYRGYKSEAKERRELFAGDAFPAVGDITALFTARQSETAFAIGLSALSGDDSSDR